MLTNNTTNYSEDSYGRTTQVSHPEGNYESYQYDGRGNVTQKTLVSKTPGTPANIAITAGYDTTCANAVKCNQPNWSKDALGNETDYTYDPTSGLLTSVTSPPDPNNLRPQVRYTYTPMQGYFYVNSASSIVASGVNTNELTQTSACRTMAGAILSGTPGQGPFSLSGTASCVGASDESRTTVSYGPQSAGTANNLYPLSRTLAAGDNSLSAVASQTYDNIGNVVSTVGPLGNGQTTIYYFDADRRLLGNVGPVPGGIGSPLPTAVKYTYNFDGVLTETQIGTVPDQTANSWNNSFTETYHTVTTLDSYDRPVRQESVSGSTNYAISDQLYDNMGRPYCTIQYMNLGSVGGEATSCAPTQTTGAFGPDRVTQTYYDGDNRPYSVIRAVGTGIAAAETLSYSANGNLVYVIDGMTNRTSYIYDGFDRLSQTQFPVATQSSNASDPNNYEQLTYNANSAVTQKRQRDGSTITATYDNLDRAASIARSDGSTVTYTYNLIDLPTNMTRSNDGSTLTFVYDAFGRLTTEGQPYGSMSYSYDAANDRTKITWPDGFYVNYTYDYNQNVSQIEENGATSGVGLLAQYSYDGLGRRTNVTYGNGSTRVYTYDPVSRLASIQLTFPNASAYNDTIGPLTYTPSSQIATITKSNDAFAWTGEVAVTRGYTTNGLNQYTLSGTTSLGYDGRGNLNASGGTAYTYNVLNQMTVGPNATITYDDIGRLFHYVTSSATTDFYYAGSALVTETNGTSITQRYVPGPGTDEPIVWYSGGTTAGRQFLQADERGSVIAVTNSSGAVVAINSYDEFGIPAGANSGRFQYAGQTWFPEVGLYNYKARWYSPTLGRFMQTDPIGYGDGLNFYNYVHSDPVNGSDPSGLQQTTGATLNGTYSWPSDSSSSDTGGGDPGRGDTIFARPDPRIRLIDEGGVPHNKKYEPTPQDEIVVKGRKLLAQEIIDPFLQFFEEPPIVPDDPVPYPTDPTKAPGPDWKWRGKPGSKPGSKDGNWYNPNTGESLRPDLDHPEGIDPHWDYRAPDGSWYRWFGPNNMAPKGIVGGQTA